MSSVLLLPSLSFHHRISWPRGGKISVGNLKIIPGITGQAIHDDNIYMKNGSDAGANRKESDWIYHLKPGLMLDYTIPERGSLRLGYEGDWAFYDKNNDNDWKNHRGNFALDYKAPGGLLLDITNTYSRLEDPYGSPDQYAIGRISKRWENDLKSKIGFLFSENFRAFLLYNFYKQDYRNDDFDYSQDYSDHEFGVGVESRFMPRTWGFLRYHYGKRDYFTHRGSLTDQNDADSKWHRVNAGLTWDPAAKLQGELNVGYEWKSYENQSTPTGTRRDDIDTWIAATMIRYKPTTTTTLNFMITRALRDTGADTNEYFEDTGVGIELRQIILTKFTFIVGANYSKNDFNTNNREDDNYNANVGVDYKIQDWLTVGIGYNYKEKDSNIDINDFKDNQFIGSIKLVY
ncbi:MAG: hypothetical protein FJ139_11390 [Deltaproteobacteria bacterium]|nr:hypothetical protein [Deltaproteobacteria bacterium]